MHIEIIGNTAKEKENYILNNYSLLKFDSLDTIETSLKDFIHDFYSIYNRSYYSEYIDSNENTIYPKCGRSFVDLFLTCKYYFPECTLKEVKIILLSFKLNGHLCYNIGRRVYELDEVRPEWILGSPYTSDEFGWLFNQIDEDEFIETNIVEKRPRFEEILKL